METASETEAELSDLHRALDDATELLAVFLSCARGKELPPALLIDSTDKVIDRVAEWRSIISRTKAIQFEAREVMLKSALH